MTLRPAQAQQLVIPGPAGDLEAVLEEPQGGAVAKFAVVCHPHPQFGGTLDNKVVYMLARTLQELGLATLRFNFRGVGASAGSFADGSGETDDALAVVDWGRRRWPAAALWLAGFSFGSFVALRASAECAPERLITIAPPVQRMNFDRLSPPRCPWLVIQGDHDEIVDHRAVLEWAHKLMPPPQLVILPGVDHFFHGRLNELKRTLLTQLRS